MIQIMASQHPRSGLCALSDYLKKNSAVALELAAADTRDLRERRGVTRPLPRHREERRIVEDHIGRDALLARERQAFRAERLEERGIGAAQRLDRVAGGDPPALGARQPRGLIPERHGRRATQHLARAL